MRKTDKVEDEKEREREREGKKDKSSIRGK